jgi:uncharacterized protein YdcH (DUF465 family)
MEPHEQEILQRVAEENPELRHLWSQHSRYESQLADLERVRYPSEAERREIGRLKRLKLRGKEQMSRILEGHPSSKLPQS